LIFLSPFLLQNPKKDKVENKEVENKEVENNEQSKEERTEPVPMTDVDVKEEQVGPKDENTSVTPEEVLPIKEDGATTGEPAKNENEAVKNENETVKEDSSTDQPKEVKEGQESLPNDEGKKEESQETKEEEKKKEPKKKLFDEIWFIGTTKEEALKTVEDYKAEAKKYEDENKGKGGRGGRGGRGRLRDGRGRGRGGFRSYGGGYDRRYNPQERSRVDNKRSYDSRQDTSKRRYSDTGSSYVKRRRFDDYPRVVQPVYPVGYTPPYPPPPYVYPYPVPSYKPTSGSSFGSQAHYRSSQSSNLRRSTGSSGGARRGY